METAAPALSAPSLNAGILSKGQLSFVHVELQRERDLSPQVSLWSKRAALLGLGEERAPRDRSKMVRSLHLSIYLLLHVEV